MKKRLKDYYSNTNSDSACRFEKGGTSSVRKEIKGLLLKKIATALVISKRRGHFQLKNRLKDYKSSVRKEIEGLLSKYE